MIASMKKVKGLQSLVCMAYALILLAMLATQSKPWKWTK